ncbi:hypothetical protein L4C36_00350 [Photobacterium japonica]|uniref:hypothetical protein n=1 Tax=Photobacterium japonica TaxID=2910235 RepID=UPI003D0AE551
MFDFGAYLPATRTAIHDSDRVGCRCAQLLLQPGLSYQLTQLDLCGAERDVAWFLLVGKVTSVSHLVNVLGVDRHTVESVANQLVHAQCEITLMRCESCFPLLSELSIHQDTIILTLDSRFIDTCTGIEWG